MLVHILEGFVMSKQHCRTIGSLNRAEWAVKNGLACHDPSKAVQSQKEDADINNIVRNFGVTGKLPQSVQIPTYGDFDTISDYREAIEAVRAADAAFLAMPSELRSRLDHDPARFVDWCADPANAEEMRKLGLMNATSAPSASEAS